MDTKQKQFVERRAAARRRTDAPVPSVRIAVQTTEPVESLQERFGLMLWNADGKGGLSRRQAD
jgi:hypothetical protein